MPSAGAPGQGEGHPRKRADFPRAARPPATSGKPGIPFLRVRGSGTAPPAEAPSPGCARAPGSQRSRRPPRGRGRRAQSWAAGTAPPARRILCCAPLGSGGSPGSRGPRPGRPDPVPAPGTKGDKAPPILLHVLERLYRRRRRAPGRWDFGEGARGRTPQPPPTPGRVPGSVVKASPPTPTSASAAPPPPLPLRPPGGDGDLQLFWGGGAAARGGRGDAGREWRGPGPRQPDADPEDRGRRERARRAGAARRFPAWE
ncbi:basic proline-rich protein-like isoform X2 [Equus quagga]|uniref:basic proline-rich protein-like isoform X2 n=1 Tax=Equus quagga TaxID=89248 RepID=UPI001EE302B2|nr:basic proline-rich protein-like isoform X2 [Equus quagga]